MDQFAFTPAGTQPGPRAKATPQRESEMTDWNKSNNEREAEREAQESALTQILGHLAPGEHKASLPDDLSADVPAYTSDGQPIISVINVKTREHWHLVLTVLDPA